MWLSLRAYACEPRVRLVISSASVFVPETISVLKIYLRKYFITFTMRSAHVTSIWFLDWFRLCGAARCLCVFVLWRVGHSLTFIIMSNFWFGKFDDVVAARIFRQTVILINNIYTHLVLTRKSKFGLYELDQTQAPTHSHCNASHSIEENYFSIDL